jgi:alkanesulfonate monooxygenase
MRASPSPGPSHERCTGGALAALRDLGARARNRALVQAAEALGFDSVLVAQHTINPHDGEREQLEAWTAAAALAALTERIEIIAAIKPYLYHPVVLAKMALGIEEISGGRFALNLVNAWNRPELEPAGIGFAEHDAPLRLRARVDYRRGVAAARRAHHLPRRAFPGRRLRAAPGRPVPAAALDLRGRRIGAGARAGGRSRRHLVHQRPALEEVRTLADVAAKPRGTRPPLRFGLSAFVVARATDAEAQAEHRRLLALAALDAPLRAASKANIDPKAVMFQTFGKSPRVGSNGGTATGLVGSYETVAGRIADFHAAGIELFMLQFQPLETRRFAEQAPPRVRARVRAGSPSEAASPA